MSERTPQPERFDFTEEHKEVKALERERPLHEETYQSIIGAIDSLMQTDDARPLHLNEAHPFREAIFQEELDEGVVGDSITEKEVIGESWSWARSTSDSTEEIEVVRLNPVGVGIATAETAPDEPISRLGYVRFLKVTEDASCTGIHWVLGDKRIYTEAEMIIPTDSEKGFDAIRFAGKVGLSAVWQAGLTDYEPGQNVMSRVTFNRSINERMGQELLEGISGFIDQSVKEQ